MLGYSNAAAASADPCIRVDSLRHTTQVFQVPFGASEQTPICVPRKFLEPFLLLEFHGKHSYRWFTVCHNTLQLPFQKEFLQNEVNHLLMITSFFFFFFSALFGLAFRMLSNSFGYIDGSLSTAVGAKCSGTVWQEPGGTEEMKHRLWIHWGKCQVSRSSNCEVELMRSS